jgi:predicted nucleic acid-binding protein
MKPLVVDASVVAAAFFQERYAKAAQQVLLSTGRLLAPDLLYAEVANVIWKRQRRGDIRADEAAELLGDILELPLEITTCKPLLSLALELAVRTGCTAYDCLYVALALQEQAVLITADQRLVNALAAGPLRRHLAWLGGPTSQ